MTPDLTPLMRAWSRRRLAVLDAQDAVAAQRRTLRRLLRRAASTRFGRAHGFGHIADVAAFQKAVPLKSFESLRSEWWGPAMPRVGGQTWPGPIPYFALSSGTTGAATKRIPVSTAMLRSNRASALDVLAFHLRARPQSRLLSGRTIMLGGSTALDTLAPGIRSGDLSAIAAIDVPAWARPMTTPPPAIALIGDWRVKMTRIAALARTQTITAISGTPSWMLPFFEVATQDRPGARLRDLFPALELIIHGGVSMGPYRDHFDWWLEGSGAETREVYAASEGFIAAVDASPDDGMRLELDHGLFMEFVRPADLGSANPDRRWVADAEIGVEYALVLTTNAGMWSYVLGDTVMLTSLNPPRVRITGRLGWMLSVAGEHITGGELDVAMAEAGRAVGRHVVDYAAAGVAPGIQDTRPGHLFVVELDGEADLAVFSRVLDETLARGSDDYAAHRAGDFSLRPPDLRVVKPGHFAAWMASRSKLGGQNKVPRVIADPDLLRSLLDER